MNPLNFTVIVLTLQAGLVAAPTLLPVTPGIG